MRVIVWMATLVPLLTATLPAQQQGERVRLVGMTFDHWEGSAGPALLRPTLRATNLGGSLGSDFALTFFPDGFSLRPPFITVGLEAGLVQRVAVGPASLLLEGGGAALVSAGVGGDRYLHIIPGVHWGLGLLLPLEAKSLVRVDLTRHLYRTEGQSVRMWSLGVGFVVRRR